MKLRQNVFASGLIFFIEQAEESGGAWQQCFSITKQ
jgi:hypothetical protein